MTELQPLAILDNAGFGDAKDAPVVENSNDFVPDPQIVGCPFGFPWTRTHKSPPPPIEKNRDTRAFALTKETPALFSAEGFPLFFRQARTWVQDVPSDVRTFVASITKPAGKAPGRAEGLRRFGVFGARRGVRRRFLGFNVAPI